MSWLIDPIISWLTILVMRSGDSIGVKGILIFFWQCLEQALHCLLVHGFLGKTMSEEDFE